MARDSLSCLEPAFGVVIARTTAVAASPPRPGQYQLDSARVRPDQLSEQVTNFGNSQRKQWSGGLGGIESSLKSRASLLLSTDHGREGMGEHHERDMYVIRNRSGAHYSRITYIIRTVTKEHSE